MTLEIDIMIGWQKESLKQVSAQDKNRRNMPINLNEELDMNSKKESNMTKIKWLEKQIIRFLKIFEKKVGLVEENMNNLEDQRMN